MFSRKYIIISLVFYTISIFPSFSQKSKSIENLISDSLTVIANKYASVGKIGSPIISVNTTEKTITVIASDILSQIPFRYENTQRIYNALHSILDTKYAGYKINCQSSDKINIENYIPNFFREKKEIDTKRIQPETQTKAPLVTNISKPFKPTAGLQNRHIALWQSHGLYYDQKKQKWIWQRPVLFNTVEDLYTQSYVLPYLVPMLENAGANVLLPRERDVQTNEIIVDNDSKESLSRYRDHSDRKSWKTQEDGFANPNNTYIKNENPFHMGTYRYVQTISENDETSNASWIPNIPESGFYAVYVSYKSVKNSTTDARYTVYHKGGKTTFKVNQTMNGGTWTYLGTFKFDKGKNNAGKVELSNYSTTGGKIVTADAVKFGGGMGNISRYPEEDESAKELAKDSLAQKKQRKTEPAISGFPRYKEGARYWLQWAGVPDSVYSRTQSKNDYLDDFQSRGFWVNYLAGGSEKEPTLNGLNIPIDMAFAFHSDAGTSKNDSIIGTLGICTVNNTQGSDVFMNTTSRWTSRDMVDVIQSQIVSDVRKIAPEWARRGIWNKSYSESRVPEVPTMLLELLSHQNFADMRYGLDPRFKFTVSRAIYKGISRYLAQMYGFEYVVQPLPVQNMVCKFAGKNKIELSWKETIDSIEPSARPEKYVIYIRTDDNDFDNGSVVKSNRVVINITPGKIYSFKVTAINKGGESFPSEILSAYKAYNDKKEVLIVNGFTRISAPSSSSKNHSFGGTEMEADAGVPYIRDISFAAEPSKSEKNTSNNKDNNESTIIAGNSFDYPYIHGKAIKAAGFSFVSCSIGAVIDGSVDLKKFGYVDVILGKQKQSYIGNGKKAPDFKTFPTVLQKKIREYCQNRGNLLLSGAYVASDFYEGNFLKPEDRFFLENTLNIGEVKKSDRKTDSKIAINASPISVFHKSDFELFNKPNDVMYHVENADVIEPLSKNAISICFYGDSNLSAGIAYNGKYKECIFGFPLETIKEEKDLNKLIESVLLFFSSGSKK